MVCHSSLKALFEEVHKTTFDFLILIRSLYSQSHTYWLEKANYSSLCLRLCVCVCAHMHPFSHSLHKLSLASLALNVGLQPAVVGLVHNTAAVARLSDCRRLSARMVVENVKNSDEEFVCVLLLVAGQVPGMCPYQMEQFEGDVGGGYSRVELFVCVCVYCVNRL